MNRYALFAMAMIWGATPEAAEARQWSDPGARFVMEADAVAFNETTVVLKKPSGKLVAVEIAELSEKDQQYLKTKEATDALPKSADQLQTWTSKDGLKVRGKVVAYGRKDLTIRRQVGRIFINDGRFSTLDELHQKLVLKIMSELEGETFADEKDLEAWAKRAGLGADPKTYPLEGVLMQLESGDRIPVPFFLFADNELEILRPGWDDWLAQEDDAARAQESFLVQTDAQQYQADQRYQREQQIQQDQQRTEIERLKLTLLATATGVISIWEVGLEPAAVYGRRTSVMVPARNSEIAAQMAMQNYPGYRVYGVRRASN